MAVPYTFAGATSSIPLSQLDTNFASTITLGNTAIQLGNTVTTLNNMTLANVTISSGNVTITNVTVTTANVTVGNITTITGTSATYTNIASGNVTITGGTLNNVAIGGTTAASGAFTTLSASGAFSLTGDQVQISEGGTGQTTANAAFNALAPSQTGNSGKYLKTDGTDTSWDAIDINTADITGTLPILNGGTGQTTANAAFNALAPSQTSQSGKYLKTDGTNASWDALDISTADITGTLPIANGGTGLTALGTGVQTALGQNVTGSGGIVLATSPVLTTPNLGTPSAATLTNATGLPISTGVSGLGTNVATALAVNVGTAGAFVVNGGALGTPSGGTLTNCTGYPTSALSGSINLATQVTGTLATTNGGTGLTSFTANGVVYASSSSALTTGSALTFDGTNFAVGGSASSYAGYGTASVNGTTGGIFDAKVNGVRVGSFFAETGSATIATATNVPLVFNIFNAEQMRLTTTGLGIGTSSPASKLHIESASAESFRIGYSSTKTSRLGTTSAGDLQIFAYDSAVGYKNILLALDAGTSVGNVGIGTSSPATKLDVNGDVTQRNGAGVIIGTITNNAGWYDFSGSTNVSGAQISTAAATPIRFLPNGTERARITSDGALLVGSSSSDLTGTAKSIVVGNFAVQNAGSAGTFLQVVPGAANGTVDLKFDARTGAYPAATFWTSNTERARIDASGNLLVGTTSSTPANANGLIAYGGTDAGILYLQRTTGTDQLRFYVGGNRLGYLNTASSAVTLGTANYPLIFSTNDTERARITSGGDLLVGTTNVPDGTTAWGVGFEPGLNSRIIFKTGVNTTSDASLCAFYNPNGIIGTIQTSGSATSYNTSSDYRLKNITGPITGSGAYIDALKPVEGTWKADGSTFVGLIAHEAQEVSRTQVATGTKDGEEMQGMDYSNSEFIANIIAELQSLRARVAQLEGASA